MSTSEHLNPGIPGDPIPTTKQLEVVFFELAAENAYPLPDRLVAEIAAMPFEDVPCEDCGGLGPLFADEASDQDREQAFAVLPTKGNPPFVFLCPGCAVAREALDPHATHGPILKAKS